MIALPGQFTGLKAKRGTVMADDIYLVRRGKQGVPISQIQNK